MSRLGLVELTRKNVTDGVYGVLTERCPCCRGEGRVLSNATRRIAVERRMREIVERGRHSAYLIALHPETYALVNAPGNNALSALRAQTGKHIALAPDANVGVAEVRVIIEGKGAAETPLA
jgi:ribonuclease G